MFTTRAGMCRRPKKGNLALSKRDCSITRKAGIVAAVACVLLATFTLRPGTATADDADAAATYSYVALGDSFTSGPMIPRQVNVQCGRSDQNYPRLVAASIGAQLTDVSCGGARLRDMTNSQFPGTPPQLDALRADTDLVTVSIGGNDLPFGEVVAVCGSLGTVNPYGQPCTDYYNRNGTDELAARLDKLRPQIAAVVTEIKRRSPAARVVFVGVPSVVPASGSCWGPNLPVAPGDYPYLVRLTKALNATYAAAAADAGAEYADIFTGSVGHDICQPKGTRWVEGLIPQSAAAPVHPNALGMQGAADQVVAALD